MLPPLTIPLDELEGEVDLLDVIHWCQGVVVLTFCDEGVGLEGLSVVLGGGGGLDVGSCWGRWRWGLLLLLWLLGLGQGQGDLVPCHDELDAYPVEVGYGGGCGRESGGGAPWVVGECHGEGRVCVGGGSGEDGESDIELSISEVHGVDESCPFRTRNIGGVCQGEGRDIDDGGHFSRLGGIGSRSGGGCGWCR